MSHTVTRDLFTLPLASEYFSADELQKRIGYPPGLWPLIAIKELVDNALDACENAQVAPEIEVSLEANALVIRDNGPGIPAAAVTGAIDFSARSSSNLYIASPTRGQQGNALKVLLGMAFIAGKGDGLIEIEANGECHRIEIRHDPITQAPRIEHKTEPSTVKIGSLVKIHWPAIA